MASCGYNKMIEIFDPEYHTYRPRQVVCNDAPKKCSNCGWNPTVARERTARIMIKNGCSESYEQRYRNYEKEKQKLNRMVLSPKEYEQKIRELADKYDI